MPSPTPASKTRRRSFFSTEHELYRDTVRRFIAQEVTPHHAAWEEQGRIPREVWKRAGAVGLLMPMAPAEYGGGGGDFLHTAIVVEEIAAALATGIAGFTTHSDIVAPYVVEFGTEEQKRRWIPGLTSGEVVSSIAMTEPSAGSDLKAIRSTALPVDGGWKLNGQKTFITNGFHADRVLVVAKTQPEAGAKGFSLLWVDAKSPGFAQGNPLKKIGQLAQDTAELFFDNVFVPRSDLIGEENKGFGYLMHGLVQERLMIAMRCATALEAALGWTIEYTKERSTFGKPLITNQHTRFKLAEIKTLAAATRAFVDQCVVDHMQGELDAEGAAMAKLWASEASSAIDELLQMFGGYGYMREYAIARAFADVRPNRIYGGSSEMMKEIISRNL